MNHLAWDQILMAPFPQDSPSITSSVGSPSPPRGVGCPPLDFHGFTYPPCITFLSTFLMPFFFLTWKTPNTLKGKSALLYLHIH